MEYIILIIGFILLVKCADIFVDGSSNVAKSLKIPTLIIGLTIVAFGTSAPEASVSIIGAIEHRNEISIGNVIGSNICNLLLVLGVSSLFKPLKCNKKIIKRDLPFSILTYVVLFLLTINKYIEKKEGLLLLITLIVYLFTIIKQEYNNMIDKKDFSVKDLLKIIFGLIGIILGGNAVVDGAVIIAENFGVSEQLIALTIVAVGTSLPELFTSVIASIKNENDIAIGNVIGSNIFNILFILGMSSFISPLTINNYVIIDIIIMFIVGIILYIFVNKESINRKNGIVMILIYFIYIFYIINR